MNEHATEKLLYSPLMQQQYTSLQCKRNYLGKLQSYEFKFTITQNRNRFAYKSIGAQFIIPVLFETRERLREQIIVSHTIAKEPSKSNP